MLLVYVFRVGGYIAIAYIGIKSGEILSLECRAWCRVLVRLVTSLYMIIDIQAGKAEFKFL